MYTKELDKLTEKYKIQYHHKQDSTYYLNAIRSNIADKKDNVLMDIINIFAKAAKEYAILDKFNKKIEKPAYNMLLLAVHKIKQKNQTLNSCQKLYKSNLDNLTITGLKDLCAQNKLDIKKCKLK